jgi:hypothetical protein
MQNEFAIWQEFDPHAKTYSTLSKPEAKAITAKLGLGDPAQAKICLDCHNDNQPATGAANAFRFPMASAAKPATAEPSSG